MNNISRAGVQNGRLKRREGEKVVCFYSFGPIINVCIMRNSLLVATKCSGMCNVGFYKSKKH